MPRKLFTMYAYSATVGGESTVCVTLTHALKKLGWDVDLVTRLTTPYEYPFDNGPNIKLLHRPLTLSLAKYLKHHKPDVLMSFDEIPNTEAIVARILSGYPNKLITRYDCPLYTPYYPSKFIYRLGVRTKIRRFLLRNFLIDKSDAIIAVSDGIAHSIKSTYPNLSTPLHRLYNPLDVARIQSLMADESDVHPWFNEDIPVLVSVCRLDPEKDIPTMLRAFAIALKERPIRLIVVGVGVLDKYLKQMATDLGINHAVSFTGYVKNQYPYMYKADVFVMSSYAEGLGCSLQEALICGATIVTTDYDYGASEILENGKYGTLVPIMDPTSMAQAMLHAIDHKRDPQNLMNKAHSFDIAPHIDSLLSVIDV